MFASQNRSFISDVTQFVKSHPVLCVSTFGLAILGYVFKGLSWRCISWILSCTGTTKKVDEVSLNQFKSQDQQFQNPPIDPLSINDDNEKILASSSSQLFNSQLDSGQSKIADTSRKLLQIPHDPIETIEGDYSIERLKNLQKELDLSGIPLHVNPKQPAKDIAVVDKEKLEAYIARFSRADREIVQSIFKDYFLHITFQMLQDSLRRCTEKLNRALNFRSYTVGFSSGKSTQWVASLALRYLEQLPDNWTPLGPQSTDSMYYSDYIPEERMQLPEGIAQPIVIFDDCGYSGTQLKEVVVDIARSTTQELEIYLVVPFMSEIARKNVLENYQFSLVSNEQKENVKVHLITDRTIPTIRSMDENQKATLKMISRNISFDDKITKFLVTTDWRIPDNLPAAFGRYAMYDVQNRVVLNEDLPSEQYFIKFPSQVPRPYALKKDPASST